MTNTVESSIPTILSVNFFDSKRRIKLIYIQRNNSAKASVQQCT